MIIVFFYKGGVGGVEIGVVILSLYSRGVELLGLEFRNLGLMGSWYGC